MQKLPSFNRKEKIDSGFVNYKLCSTILEALRACKN